jgi:hypothetical protein
MDSAGRADLMMNITGMTMSECVRQGDDRESTFEAGG